MTRYAFYAIAVALVVVLIIAVRASGGPMPRPMPDVGGSDTSSTPTPLVAPPARTAVQSFLVTALRKQVAREHRRYLAAHRRVRALTRTLAHSPTTREAISLACIVYGSCDTLWRRAQCESGLSTFARNSSGASGLFQFLPSTFSSTPFGSFSIWSPYAQALAAGWMNAHGRGGEWVCR